MNKTRQYDSGNGKNESHCSKTTFFLHRIEPRTNLMYSTCSSQPFLSDASHRQSMRIHRAKLRRRNRALGSLAACMRNAREAIRRDLFAINPVLVNCDVSVLVVVVKVSWYAIFLSDTISESSNTLHLTQCRQSEGNAN